MNFVVVVFLHKGPFTNTCKGGLMQKIFIAKIFRGPPSDHKKISGAPFLPWKLRVNPIKKHVNSIFNGKSVAIFFRAPFIRVKNFKGLPFCIRPPHTSVCERSLRMQHEVVQSDNAEHINCLISAPIVCLAMKVFNQAVSYLVTTLGL